MTTARCAVTINHPIGLHARPAIKLTRLAKTFAANIRLRGRPEGRWVNAKSIVNVIGLNLPAGALLELEAEGDAADAALLALSALIERDFDEDD